MYHMVSRQRQAILSWWHMRTAIAHVRQRWCLGLHCPLQEAFDIVKDNNDEDGDDKTSWMDEHNDRYVPVLSAIYTSYFCFFITAAHIDMNLREAEWQHVTIINILKQQTANDILVRKQIKEIYMSQRTTKPTKCICAKRRFRSAWPSAQSDQCLYCPHEESLDP